MPTYRSILKKALEITLKNKRLLVFGFLLAIMGNGGEYDLFIRNAYKIRDLTIPLGSLPEFFTTNRLTLRAFEAMQGLILSHSPLMNFALIVLFGALIYLTITAQGALILTLYAHVRKKHKVNLPKQWRAARAQFWELFFTNILFKGAGIIIAFIISAPIFIFITSITQFDPLYSALLIGFIIFTPILVITSFLIKYTLLYLLTKHKAPWTSLVQSIHLFKQHWLITLENAILLLFLNLILGIVVAVIGFIISFPIITAIALATPTHTLPQGHSLTIIAWVTIVLIVVFGSALAVFQYSTWTILFTKLTSKRILASKIVRLEEKIKKK